MNHQSHSHRRSSKDKHGKPRRGRFFWTSSRRTYDEAEETSEYISALQIVHDSFYYMGFMQLAKYMVFLSMGIVMLLFHVSTLNSSPNTGYFRSSITSALVGGEGPDSVQWDDVDSFFSAAVYYKKFLENIVQDSDARKLPGTTVMIGEYGEVIHARVIVNFEENCYLRNQTIRQQRNATRVGINCWDEPDPELGNKPAREYFSWNVTSNYNIGDWHSSPRKYYKFRSSIKSRAKLWSALIVINKQAESRQTFLDFINTQLNDTQLALLGRYPYTLGLDIIAQNTMDRDDYAIYSLRAQRSSSGGGEPSRDAFKKLSITTPGKRFLYASREDGLRRIVEVIFWIAYVWVVGLDIIQLRLARRQGYTFYAYFKHLWNLYNWATNIALLVWLITYLEMYWSWHQEFTKTPFPSDPRHCTQFYRYEHYAAKYASSV